jgi:FolB domain-containing protein
MDKIFIQGVKVRGVIGIHEWEREKPQDILIDIALFCDTRNAGKSDNIQDCVDYEIVVEKVIDHVKSTQRFTVEALANDLAYICLDYPGVEKVRVCVEKPAALQNVQSVGVEIERSQVG